MTAPRRDGGGSEFGKWLREDPELDSVKYGLCISDIDWIVWKYKLNQDGQGTRCVKLTLWLEIKTFCASLHKAQQELLFAYHKNLHDKRQRIYSPFINKEISCWTFGCFVVRLSSGNPRRSKNIWLGRFTEKGHIEYIPINEETLRGIVSFNLDPYTLLPIHHSLRRHHKVTELIEQVQAPLGFQYERVITKRS